MKREKKKFIVYIVHESIHSETSFTETGIKAGFPSPATDYIQESIDLNKVLVPHPDSTYVVVAERGMTKEKCIEEGDLLVIDQSLKPSNNKLVAYTTDGEFNIGDSYPEDDSNTTF